jgi:hypothetical protein
MEKTHWKKVFSSDYLGSCDFEPGKDIKAVIKAVEVRKVKNTDGKEQERNVAIFTDASIKPMILNVTNCKVVKKFAKSPFINDWKNVAIQIYVKDDIKAFGEVTEGLRIREIEPKTEKPELVPTIPSWEKAIDYLKGNGTIEGIRKNWKLSEANEQLLKAAVI